jgi:hypothetical protein
VSEVLRLIDRCAEHVAETRCVLCIHGSGKTFVPPPVVATDDGDRQRDIKEVISE